MDLRHFRYFRTVAEELSITRAAQRLHIAQPPLTRQIRQLETELGAVLFERHPRGLTLTPAGHFFYEQAVQILERVEVSIAATRRIARSGRQWLGLGFVPSALYGQLPALIRTLRQNEQIELVLSELTTVRQGEALKAGRIDIGFGRLRLDDPELIQDVLFEEPIIAALPRGHALAQSPPTLAQLAEVPLIVYPGTPRPSYADNVLGLFRRRGLKVHVIQEANELQTAIGLVASEMGATLVPTSVQRMHREDVAYVALAETGIVSPVVMSRRKEQPSELLEHVIELSWQLTECKRTGHT